MNDTKDLYTKELRKIFAEKAKYIAKPNIFKKREDWENLGVIILKRTLLGFLVLKKYFL